MPGIIKYRGWTRRRMAWARQSGARPKQRKTEKPHGRWRQEESEGHGDRWRDRKRARDVWTGMRGVIGNKRNKRDDEFKDTRSEMQPGIQTHRPKERHRQEVNHTEGDKRERSWVSNVPRPRAGLSGRTGRGNYSRTLPLQQSHLQGWWPHLLQSCWVSMCGVCWGGGRRWQQEFAFLTRSQVRLTCWSTF